MAKPWTDDLNLFNDSRVLSAFILVLAGVAAWDVLATSWYDASIVTRKRPFKPTMALYFFCRVCMLLHIFPMAALRNPVGEVPCQSINYLARFGDAFGTCGATLLFILHTRAIWKGDKLVTFGLGALFAAQIALWMQVFPHVSSRWDASKEVCISLSEPSNAITVAIYGYTMSLTLVILLLCVYGLSTGPKTGRAVDRLLAEGIGYLAGVFIAQFLQLLMGSLPLNSMMKYMCVPLALVVSVIAATTVYRTAEVLTDHPQNPVTSSINLSGISLGFRFSRPPPSKPAPLETLADEAGERSIKSNHEVSVHRTVEYAVDDALPRKSGAGQAS